MTLHISSVNFHGRKYSIWAFLKAVKIITLCEAAGWGDICTSYKSVMKRLENINNCWRWRRWSLGPIYLIISRGVKEMKIKSVHSESAIYLIHSRNQTFTAFYKNWYLTAIKVSKSVTFSPRILVRTRCSLSSRPHFHPQAQKTPAFRKKAVMLSKRRI